MYVHFDLVSKNADGVQIVIKSHGELQSRATVGGFKDPSMADIELSWFGIWRKGSAINVTAPEYGTNRPLLIGRGTKQTVIETADDGKETKSVAFLPSMAGRKAITVLLDAIRDVWSTNPAYMTGGTTPEPGKRFELTLATPTLKTDPQPLAMPVAAKTDGTKPGPKAA